jgi:hypothetical protein
MSIERAADLMGLLLDAPVSTGFAGGLVGRVAERLAGFEQALKDRLRAAAVMHTTRRRLGSPATTMIGCCTSTPPGPGS